MAAEIPPETVSRERRFEIMRELWQDLASGVTELLPPSRERSLALTSFEQGMLWAGAALAQAPELNHQE